MVGRVDGNIVGSGEVGQDLDDVVDGAVGVLLDRVRLHEWVQADDVKLAGDDAGFERVGQLATHGLALLVERHQLAPGRSRRSQEQPALQV
jgi:hypothetical protein